jgi:hypothetical protein
MWEVDRDTVGFPGYCVSEKLTEIVTAVLHHLAPQAKVVGIEHIKELAEQSKSNLITDGVNVGVNVGAAEGAVEIIQGDGRLGQLGSLYTRQKADNKDHQLTVSKFVDEG